MDGSRKLSLALTRRALLAAAGVSAMFSMAPALAQDVTGEMVFLQWITGTETAMWEDIKNGFMAKYPGVTIREVGVTAGGDARGGIRTALLGGEKVDVMINTWPAFRTELVDAGLLEPLDEAWAKYSWDNALTQSWKDLGSIDGTVYGVQYEYGDRSAIWYSTAQHEKAGIATPPTTWEEFIGNFPKLQEAGFEPIAMPAKYWAHAEWFESILLRVGGVETAAKLAAHEIPWTDPIVKTALQKFAEMLAAGGIKDVETAFSNDWDGAADQIFKANASSYLLIGMWMNGRAKTDYQLEEGVDYSIFQFPALGMGHDDTSSVDAKELVVVTTGDNPTAAQAFIDYVISAEGSNILAKAGHAAASSNADTSIYGPVIQKASEAVSTSKVQFVLGDLLPGDLVDEYRVQLQKFLQDPSDANIDAVLAAIEAKASESY